MYNKQEAMRPSINIDTKQSNVFRVKWVAPILMVLFVGFYQWSLAVIEMFDYLRCATNPPHKQINKIPGYASILNWRNY